MSPRRAAKYKAPDASRAERNPACEGACFVNNVGLIRPKAEPVAQRCLIVTCTGHFITHGRRDKWLPCGFLPCPETSMHIKIFFGYRVRAYNDLDLIAFLKKSFECIDIGTGGITNYQAGS
jgi:hypothetical protein